MPLDHYLTLGHSGLRVSPFCLGGMTFGEDLGWGASVETSGAIIDRYLELGGNFLDTADGYTKGHSETIIGAHLARDRTKRDRVVIATKFSANLYPGDPNGGGSSRKAVMAACEQSLRRLQTDYIDLYWLHNWDRHTPIEETVSVLQDLVQAGKVRYIGVSDTPAWKVTQAKLISDFRGWASFIGLQIEYSLLQRTVEGELIPMARELGLGVMPWSPLARGLLSGKYTRQNAGKVEDSGRAPTIAGLLTDRHYDIIDALRAIANEIDTTVASVALAWVRARPGVTSTIIGARTLNQFDDNIHALDLQLAPEQTSTLDELTTPQLPFPLEFLRMTPAIHHAGTTVNGQPSELFPFSPRDQSDHY
jgi:aryl-alcohol dehydrogenase-like predicted oxidoreductase